MAHSAAPAPMPPSLHPNVHDGALSALLAAIEGTSKGSGGCRACLDKTCKDVYHVSKTEMPVQILRNTEAATFLLHFSFCFASARFEAVLINTRVAVGDLRQDNTPIPS